MVCPTNALTFMNISLHLTLKNINKYSAVTVTKKIKERTGGKNFLLEMQLWTR